MPTEIENVVRVPANKDEITSAWLTQALSIGFPGAAVTSIDFGDEIYGTGAKIQVFLKYNDEGQRLGLPPTMWVKGPFHEYSQNITAAFDREVLFYRDVAPLVNIHCPRSYFANQGIVLMEDLLAANASFGDPTVPLSVDMVRDVLTMQARYHALWWESDELKKVGQRGGSLKQDGVIERLMAPDSWNRAMARPRSGGVPQPLRDRDVVWKGILNLLDINDQQQECLLHGDPHLGNMYFVDGKVGLLDWQRMMRGAWIWDVAYMLAGSLATEDRRAHEFELLRFYLDELGANGVTPPSFEKTRELYLANLFYGMVWTVVPDGTQTEEAIRSVSSRFAAAIADLHKLR